MFIENNATKVISWQEKKQHKKTRVFVNAKAISLVLGIFFKWYSIDVINKFFGNFLTIKLLELLKKLARNNDWFVLCCNYSWLKCIVGFFGYSYKI